MEFSVSAAVLLLTGTATKRPVCNVTMVLCTMMLPKSVSHVLYLLLLNGKESVLPVQTTLTMISTQKSVTNVESDKSGMLNLTSVSQK